MVQVGLSLEIKTSAGMSSIYTQINSLLVVYFYQHTYKEWPKQNKFCSVNFGGFKLHSRLFKTFSSNLYKEIPVYQNL